MQNKSVGTRPIRVLHSNDSEQLKQCQAIFFSRSISDNLAGILHGLSGKPILTLTDHSNAISNGCHHQYESGQ
ncbi:MAG: YfiR family protein [Nitrosomonas sp.]|nr:YfiR family protein [Nitrosomonas sp.]UJP04259.1 MAG: YfiR family protein [Nitrosomonas sp.]